MWCKRGYALGFYSYLKPVECFQWELLECQLELDKGKDSNSLSIKCSKPAKATQVLLGFRIWHFISDSDNGMEHMFIKHSESREPGEVILESYKIHRSDEKALIFSKKLSSNTKSVATMLLTAYFCAEELETILYSKFFRNDSP